MQYYLKGSVCFQALRLQFAGGLLFCKDPELNICGCNYCEVCFFFFLSYCERLESSPIQALLLWSFLKLKQKNRFLFFWWHTNSVAIVVFKLIWFFFFFFPVQDLPNLFTHFTVEVPTCKRIAFQCTDTHTHTHTHTDWFSASPCCFM